MISSKADSVLPGVFNILEKAGIFVIFAHPKYTKPQKGNKTNRKDAKWICDIFMCEMIKPSFIPPAGIRHFRSCLLVSWGNTEMMMSRTMTAKPIQELRRTSVTKEKNAK